MDVLRLIVPARSQGRFLKYWVADQVPGLSSSLARRLIRKGAITVNGERLRIEKYEVVVGDVVEVDRSRFSLLEPVPMAFDVLYEDDEVIVINKPAHLVVHPAKDHPKHTVINGLVARYATFEPLALGWPRKSRGPSFSQGMGYFRNNSAERRVYPPQVARILHPFSP